MSTNCQQQKVASDPRPLSAVSPSAAYPTFENSNNATRQYPADVIQERAALERIARVFSSRMPLDTDCY
ncbi:hypothetical protein VKT23_005098 [Stygiomarasmius scandens]|uniref:Uncharacterized protein n=1 Tax=Marasmiellus scandens TaxID=2682957 RepID=A0ABR1JS48_9AGAR